MTENDKIAIAALTATASAGLAYYIKVARPKRKIKKWTQSRQRLIRNVKSGLLYDLGDENLDKVSWLEKLEIDNKFIEIAIRTKDL